jgi:hypothetical protein
MVIVNLEKRYDLAAGIGESKSGTEMDLTKPFWYISHLEWRLWGNPRNQNVSEAFAL